jgi:hypothetical protein
VYALALSRDKQIIPLPSGNRISRAEEAFRGETDEKNRPWHSFTQQSVDAQAEHPKTKGGERGICFHDDWLSSWYEQEEVHYSFLMSFVRDFFNRLS